MFTSDPTRTRTIGFAQDINATKSSISTVEKSGRKLVDGLRKEHREAQERLLKSKK